jgi:hypothetical protein
MTENYIVLDIYQYSPVLPVPMIDGLVMLDLKALEFLMDIYDVAHEDRRLLLHKLALYHGVVYGKKNVEEEEKSGEIKEDL